VLIVYNFPSNNLQGHAILPSDKKQWLDHAHLTDSHISTIHSTHHWALDCAVAISPIILFVDFTTKGLSRVKVMRFCKALGTSRPPDLYRLEVSIWNTILGLRTEKDRLDRPHAWFNLPKDSQGSSVFFGSEHMTSPLGFIPLSLVDKRVDLALGMKSLTTNVFVSPDEYGSFLFYYHPSRA
jgi:hypothetical protein